MTLLDPEDLSPTTNVFDLSARVFEWIIPSLILSSTSFDEARFVVASL
jgi:hypothetical protein